MFARLTQKEIRLFARVFIPTVVLTHLYSLPYYNLIFEEGYLNIKSWWYGPFFHKTFLYLYLLYCVLGFIYFLRPKVVLPIMVILCSFIQGTLYNLFEWHDFQVTYFSLLTITTFYFKPNWFEKVPIRNLVLLFFSIQFFGASISKLTDSGLPWADGKILQHILVEYHIYYELPISYSLAKNLFLCRLFSSLILFFQFSFPLCLFFEKIQKLYIFFTLLFFIVVFFFLRISLEFILPSLFIFLPWGIIIKRLEQIKFKLNETI